MYKPRIVTAPPSTRVDSIEAVSDAADGLTRACASLSAFKLPVGADYTRRLSAKLALQDAFRAAAFTPLDMVSRVGKIK